MQIDIKIKPQDLSSSLENLFSLAEKKVAALDRAWDKSRGTPVFTVAGKYTARGWTEWTQGFQYGCAILTFDATNQQSLLKLGRDRTRELMAPHLTHVGVHDHGFNNLSTYGNLRRLMLEKRIKHDAWELEYYELAIKASGAVQAARWSSTSDGLGYVYSFNGPHSLFVDTMRTIRIMGLAHKLGHVLMGENDAKINLLDRAITHALCTAKYIMFDGKSDHVYDVCGRTCHEAVFNRNDGRFRARSTQQGYSPFSTWSRGLAWAMLGYAEELEFLETLSDSHFTPLAASRIGNAGALDSRSRKRRTNPKQQILQAFEGAAIATCDHYLNDCSTTDGIVYWDDGAPGLAKMEDWREQPADPYSAHEPVDSSASAIAAQGLLRLGRYLGPTKGKRYTQAGLSIAKTLLTQPYLSTDPNHQGLLLHSVYHRPNNWDYIPPGQKVPCGESSMWGDYHLLELGVYLKRLIEGGRYLTFF